MYYQNYEDYMRAVLGYANNEPNYTYDNYYPRIEQQSQYGELESLYPDIYRVVNPIVEDICNKNRSKPITEELITSMTDEVYNNVEGKPSTQVNAQAKHELKNGDVRNPNVKSSESKNLEPRQKNYLLSDLIRILILKNLLMQRAPFKPQFPGSNSRPPYMGMQPSFLDSRTHTNLYERPVF